MQDYGQHNGHKDWLNILDGTSDIIRGDNCEQRELNTISLKDWIRRKVNLIKTAKNKR